MINRAAAQRLTGRYLLTPLCWPVSNASRRVRSLALIGRNKDKPSAIDSVLQNSQKAAKLRSGENIDPAANLKKMAAPSQQRNVRQYFLHLR